MDAVKFSSGLDVPRRLSSPFRCAEGSLPQGSGPRSPRAACRLRALSRRGARDGSVLGVRVSRKRKLNCFAAGLRLKVRKRHADESNAFRRWEYRSDEAKRQLTQLLLGSDRHFHRPAAGRNPEVGPFNLHRDRPATSVRSLAPGPDVVGHGDHAGFDLNGIS